MNNPDLTGQTINPDSQIGKHLNEASDRDNSNLRRIGRTLIELGIDGTPSRYLDSGLEGDVYLVEAHNVPFVAKVTRTGYEENFRRSALNLMTFSERETKVDDFPNPPRESYFVQGKGGSTRENVQFMELARGKTIGELTDTEKQELSWLVPLQIAHLYLITSQMGIINNDTKLANILVDPKSGSLKVIDLGEYYYSTESNIPSGAKDRSRQSEVTALLESLTVPFHNPAQKQSLNELKIISEGKGYAELPQDRKYKIGQLVKSEGFASLPPEAKRIVLGELQLFKDPSLNHEDSIEGNYTRLLHVMALAHSQGQNFNLLPNKFNVQSNEFLTRLSKIMREDITKELIEFPAAPGLTNEEKQAMSLPRATEFATTPLDTKFFNMGLMPNPQFEQFMKVYGTIYPRDSIFNQDFQFRQGQAAGVPFEEALTTEINEINLDQLKSSNPELYFQAMVKKDTINTVFELRSALATRMDGVFDQTLLKTLEKKYRDSLDQIKSPEELDRFKLDLESAKNAVLEKYPKNKSS